MFIKVQLGKPKENHISGAYFPVNPLTKNIQVPSSAPYNRKWVNECCVVQQSSDTGHIKCSLLSMKAQGK